MKLVQSDTWRSRLAAFATLTAVVGFVCQFVGLRALHWSATIYQLGVMLFMTIVRSLVRRGLAADPIFYPLLDGHEIAWLTFYMIYKDEAISEEDLTESQESAITIHTGTKAASNQSHVIPRPTANLDDQIQHAASRPFYNLTPREPLMSREPGRARPELRKRSRWSKRFPWVRIVKHLRDDRTREDALEQRMLEHIVRWEPLTGYQSIETVRQSFRSIHSKNGCPARIRSILEDEDARLHRTFFPLSQIGALLHKTETVAGREPLNLCKDLQRLMPTSNETTDVAASLAMAIERTMAVLGKSEHVSWHAQEDPFIRDVNPIKPEKPRHVRIRIPVLQGNYDLNHESSYEAQLQEMEILVYGTDPARGTFEGAYKRDTMIWQIDRDDLASFICIWQFSLGLRKSVASKVALAMRQLQPQISTLRLGHLYSEELVDARNAFTRVVGGNSESADYNDPRKSLAFTELQRWLTHGISVMPALGGYEYQPPTSPEDAPDTHAARRGSIEESPVNAWVVWGLPFSRLSE